MKHDFSVEVCRGGGGCARVLVCISGSAKVGTASVSGLSLCMATVIESATVSSQ